MKLAGQRLPDLHQQEGKITHLQLISSDRKLPFALHVVADVLA